MRHLAAHFVRHLPKGANIKKSDANKNTSLINVEPIHVVDPLVDLREYLRNDVVLNQNLKARAISSTDLPTIHANYIKWWKSYGLFRNCPDETKENDGFRHLETFSLKMQEVGAQSMRSSLSQAMRDNSDGLLAALALPNHLDEPSCSFESDPPCDSRQAIQDELESIDQKLRQSRHCSVLLRRAICSSVARLARILLAPISIHTSMLVRPAIVQYCNIGLARYPVITDGLDSPMCLVGVDLPGFFPILVKSCFIEKSNQWPITLMASGPVYQASRSRKCNQTERFNFLMLSRDVEEGKRALDNCRRLVELFLGKFVKEPSFEAVPPQKLYLWERSATAVGWRAEGVEVAELARFSNIGDYLPKRGNIMFGSSGRGGHEGNLQMAFGTLNLDALVQFMVANADG